MYTIGEISRIVNISANTLRYYDEIELLKPNHINNNNQYRYYSASQIKDIIFIMELKQYGFSLYEIKELMENRSKQMLKNLLEKKHDELYEEIHRLKENFIRLEKKISQINKEEDCKMINGKILIVDDLELARLMIKNILEQYGYEVVGEASNGEEAIVEYEKLKPDVVIMDITMPKMDGIDATKKITEKYKDAKIIICSAIQDDFAILEAIKAGVKDYVTKPLSSENLIKAILRSNETNNNFDLKTVHSASKNMKGEEYSVVSKSIILEEKILQHLNNIFKLTLKELSEYMSSNFEHPCSIDLLTVESITMNEFEKLIHRERVSTAVKYEEFELPIFIHLYGEINNDKEIIIQLTNNMMNKINLLIPKLKVMNISISTANENLYKTDYEIILISSSIEFENGENGYMAMSIPFDILQLFLE